MENKELIFAIDGKKLYLTHVLVDYMDIPIFFLCRNRNNYYVALCTNVENSSYIIVAATSSDVHDLLHGRIPMRDIILKQREYWEVISGDEIAEDIVTKHPMDVIDQQLLPEKGACFEVLTDEMTDFVKAFDNEYSHFDDYTEIKVCE